MRVKIGQKMECVRCEPHHFWYTRQAEVRMCPKCKSPYFNVKRKEKTIDDKE